jgi:hypothetical protein
LQGGECGPVEGSWLEGVNSSLDPPIANVSPGQCVLLTDSGAFHVFAHNHDIWFDHLYIRFVNPPEGSRGGLRHGFMISGQGSTSFMTGITVQGGGAQQPAGNIGEGVLVISHRSSSVHMHDAVFQDLRVDVGLAFITTGGPLSLNRTTFQNVQVPEKKAFIYVQQSGQLRLADVEFGPEEAGTPVFVENSTLSVWSDQPLQVTNALTGAATAAPGLESIPDPSPFTSLGNKWFQSLAAVRFTHLQNCLLTSCEEIERLALQSVASYEGTVGLLRQGTTRNWTLLKSEV